MRGGHSRSLPPSAGDHPGLAYTMAVTCGRAVTVIKLPPDQAQSVASQPKQTLKLLQ